MKKKNKITHIYCHRCGYGKVTEKIGLVFGKHTCIECAEEMGETPTNIGQQHL